ncbi:hypothetical protein KUCAC02_035638 [Chaenocephalus aceratus]|nr:hypothetical protein KUCAC02_035638 [Chaenocephalus aceratus]
MISGDEHMAARLGLMVLGPGPAQDSPPPERVRVGGGVGGAEVKDRDRRGGDERRLMKTGVNEQSENVFERVDNFKNTSRHRSDKAAVKKRTANANVAISPRRGQTKGTWANQGNVGKPRESGQNKGTWANQGNVGKTRERGQTKGTWAKQGNVGKPREHGQTKGTWANQGNVGKPRESGQNKGTWANQGNVGETRERGQTKGTWANQGNVGKPREHGQTAPTHT